MTEEERMILANIEALTSDGEGGMYGKSPYPNGEECYVYDNGVQKIGRASVCYDDTVSRFCTEGICMT